MNYKRLTYVILSCFLLFSQSGLALGGEEETKINWVEGPKTVDVGENLAKLNIPAKYVFANGPDAKKLMEYFGNAVTEAEVGMVVPKDQSKSWFVLFEYDQLGYVKDNDASSLDAEGLLESIKAGTEVDNEDRKKQGEAPLKILGWDEVPHYDSKNHNVVWSFLAESEGHKIVNYNVRLLGRQGMTSVTLVADEKELASIKPELETIVKNYGYVQGKKYSDYVPGQDLVADFGLTALIAGGDGAATPAANEATNAATAAKTGFFPQLLILFKKFWFILFGVGVVGIFYKKIRKRS